MQDPAPAVQADREPDQSNLDRAQQLELRLFERLDQFRGVPPEKALWRELLDLAVGTTKAFTACGKTLAASFVQHVGLLLFMRANRAGIIEATNERLADDGRRDRSRVTAALVVLNRLHVTRSTRPNRRGVSFHALNLGGLNWPAVRRRAAAKHVDAQPFLDFGSPRRLPLPDPSCGVAPQLSCGVAPQLKGYVRRVEISDPTAAAGTSRANSADRRQQQLLERNQVRIEGLFAAIASRARQLGHDFDEAGERRRLAAREIDVAALQALADDLDSELAVRGDVRRHRITSGLAGGGRCAVCGRRAPSETELCPGRPRRSRIQALAEDCADAAATGTAARAG